MVERRSIRRALVTGASGFIGRALCEELVRRDVEVVATARKTEGTGPYQWYKFELPGEIPDAALAGVDTVFHLAARAHAMTESRNDGTLYDLVNRQGTRDIARAAANTSVERFVFMSSVKAMRPPGVDMVIEDDDAMPTDPYGISKRLAEQEAFEAGTEKMDVVVLRPALVYGPGVKGNLSALLVSLKNGQRPPLPRVNNRRSLVGLGDLVRCSMLAAELDAAAGQTYVVTDGQPYSTDRIIRTLGAAVGADPTPRFRVPLAILLAAASVGDGIERLTGHRMPLSTSRLRRLVGNAEYESRRVREDLGFTTLQTLENSARDLVSTVP